MATLVQYNTLPSLFTQFYGRPVINRYHKANPALPAVNVKETEAEFVLELAAPGLKKEDLKINVEDNKLTIAYQSDDKKEETTEKFTRQEFAFHSFERQFRLPKNVNADEIKAAYTDGILTIELPKIEETKLVKEISVA